MNVRFSADFERATGFNNQVKYLMNGQSLQSTTRLFS